MACGKQPMQKKKNKALYKGIAQNGNTKRRKVDKNKDFATKLSKRLLQKDAPREFVLLLDAFLHQRACHNNRGVCLSILYNFGQRRCQLLAMGARAVVNAAIDEPIRLETVQKQARASEIRDHAVLAPPPPAPTGMFHCGKCRTSKHTLHTLAQTRSGDEGSTARVQCLKCGNCFKVC
jgi:DNA-directed RNA polymerase subunit M/transcription elongation factor TFIIS